MPTPKKHPETGIFYLRERVPADVRAKARGRKVTFMIEGREVPVTVGAEHVKVSLRTADKSTAKERHKGASATLAEFWNALRTGPRRLSQKEAVALAGEAYGELVEAHNDNPGSVERWVREEAALLLAEFATHDSTTLKILPTDVVRRRALERRLGPAVDRIIQRRSLIIDEHSRSELLEQTLSAVRQAHLLLMKRASGDYRPDPNADRFGPWEPPVPPAPPRPSLSLSALVDAWEAEARPSAATARRWRRKVEQFAAFLGHDDASRVTRADVVRWKDALVAGDSIAKPLTAKTINGNHLAALKAVFALAASNERLPGESPAENVNVRAPKGGGKRMQSLTDSEATTILTAARKDSRGPMRWIPLLLASTGARVAEIAQLRGCDIASDGGIPCMTITAEAGSLKNAVSERRLPLHPAVLAEGFLAFVEGRGDGPLFFDPSNHRKGAGTSPAQAVSQRLTRWVRGLGVNVGRAQRKDPNHAWRHRFHTKARAAGIEDSVADLITGRVPRGSAGGYGEAELRTMADAIAKIPLA